MKPTFNKITFDSPEEVEFYHWCLEAVEHSVIDGFGYQITTFVLSEPVQIEVPRTNKNGKPLTPKTRTILRGCSYTADFTLVVEGQSIHVDVKPPFERSQSRAAKFSVLRKWVYASHGVLIRPVVPIELFKQTWLPAACMLTPTGKLRKTASHRGLLTIREWCRLGQPLQDKF